MGRWLRILLGAGGISFANFCLASALTGTFRLSELTSIFGWALAAGVFSFVLFPLVLISTASASISLWSFAATDEGGCCHMGGLSDNFAFDAMMATGGSAAFLALVMLVQWYLVGRLAVGRSVAIATGVSLLWTVQASAAYLHAIKMCGSC